MYSVSVRDHFMIAHSFSGEVFGEQGNLNSVPAYDQNGYFSMPNTSANVAAGGQSFAANNTIADSVRTKT